MTHRSARLPRRRLPVLGLAALAMAIPLWPIDVGADASEPGQGFAFGQAWKVDPKAGGLSIGIAFGQSTAIHQNQVGRAVSTSTNFGVVGLTLGAQQCDGSNPTWPLNGKPTPEGQPEPLIVDSRDEGAATEKTATDWGQPKTANGPFVKSAVAKGKPFARATTTILGGGGAQGGGSFEMGTAKITSSSGLVNGVREARATVELDFLNAAGGPGFVRMTGLRWDALHRSTGKKASEGTFSIGSISLPNFSRSALSGKQATDALNAANAVLGTMGLKLLPGSIHESKNRVIVEPLALMVVPHATRDGITRTILTQDAPDPRDGRNKEIYKEVRKAVTDAIFQGRFPEDDPDTPQNETRINGCRAGTYISVADIVVGSVTGAGEFVLSLGGVEASTGESPKNDFNLDAGRIGKIDDVFIPGQPPLESSVVGNPDIVSGPVVSTFVPGTPGTPGTPGGSRPDTRLVTNAGNNKDPLPKPFTGTRGGALAVVGLVTLSVLGLMAEADRRKLRVIAAAQQAATGAGE